MKTRLKYLDQAKGDAKRADEYFRKSISFEPLAQIAAVNYGQFLIGQGQIKEGLRLIKRVQVGRQPTIALRALFNEFLHSPKTGPRALQKLRMHLENGERSRCWNFGPTLARAEQNTFKEMEFAQQLAR